ncbi:MAG: DUF11 domain-containing protein, partial [Anaerolineae bacterium]|nr:DUF11 domain-containing protein [Anaerolineae bacterium]
FPNLAPGGYIVEFQPGGFSFSPQNQGGDDTLDSDADTATGRTGVITLAAGANDQTVDAGLVDSNAFNIDSFVWLDTNGDGIQDAGEPGAGGVVVRLLRDGPTPVVVGTSVTDPTGRVMFLNLAPGDYFLEFVQPGGYAFSPVDQGGDDALDSDADATTGRTPVTSLVEGNDSTLDAGLTGPALATLGGSVWDDSNGNGVQDAGEPVRDGVTVRIYTPGGFLVATTTTSGGGLYSVANLVAGDYIVEFVPPSGTGLSPQGQGGDPALDSDPNPATGRATVTLTGGQVTDAVDAGLITSAPAPTAPPGPAPAIAIFDPALSKIGVLEAGALGLPGERVTWLFTITNVGSAAGTNIVLTDTLRPELRIDSADIDRGTVTVSGQTVTFSLPSLNPGESVAARVRTTVLSRPDGNTIVNEGVLTGTGSGGETVRRTAAAQISVPGALPATGYAPTPDNATPAALVGGAAVILALAGLIALRRRRAR